MDGSERDSAPERIPPEARFRSLSSIIGGMTGSDCMHAVAEVLESLPGVNEAQVDLGRRRARVTARPSVEPDHLTKAVRASGYSAFVRSREKQPAP
jgi:copper chaperone CopZ